MNRLISVSLSAIMTSVLFLAGCDDGAAQGAKKEEKSSITPETVLARINGHELTKKQMDDYAELRVAFYKLMKAGQPQQPVMGMAGKPAEDLEKNLEKVRQSAFTSCMPEFIQNTVIHEASEEFTKKNGDYSKADRDAVRAWVEKTYAEQNKKSIKDFKALQAKLRKAGVEEEFKRQIEKEIENELYTRVACSNRFVIDEVVITNVFVRWEINNHVSVATNRTIFTTATNLVRQLKAGADFSECADRHSMDPEKTTGGYLGFLQAADFPAEEAVWARIKDLKDGEVSDLIDADDSWHIYKVISRDESNPEDIKLELARIYFRRAWEIPKPTREEVISALEGDRRQRLVKGLMDKKLPVLKAEFPVGKKIFGNLETVQPMFDLIEGGTNKVESAKEKKNAK